MKPLPPQLNVIRVSILLIYAIIPNQSDFCLIPSWATCCGNARRFDMQMMTSPRHRLTCKFANQAMHISCIGSEDTVYTLSVINMVRSLLGARYSKNSVIAFPTHGFSADDSIVLLVWLIWWIAPFSQDKYLIQHTAQPISLTATKFKLQHARFAYSFKHFNSL